MTRTGCNPAEHPRLNRRSLVQAGGIGFFGAALGDLLRLEAEASPAPERRARAKSVVFIYQAGGATQHETFDPKPEAPSAIRGEFGAIPTSVDGFRVCEHLPLLARRAHRYAVVRSMYHPAPPQFRNEHNSASYMVRTGTCALPPGETNTSIAQPGRPFVWPSLPSLIAYALPAQTRSGLPPAIAIPRSGGNLPGEGAGPLGARYEPWWVNVAAPCNTPTGGGSCPHCFAHDQPDDPARAPGKGLNAWWDNSSCRDPSFRLPDLGLPDGLHLSRFRLRTSLRQKLDGLRRHVDTAGVMEDLDVFQQQATELVLSQTGRRNPFDLTQETDRVRDRYGREEWGQAFLLARRLVEAGVRMVQVTLRGWDTHQHAFRDLKQSLLPSLDRCLSGFLDDLHERGLLDETLVVMCGEFGRTPQVQLISPKGKNRAGEPFTPGRDHWGDVFSCFFAGGGTRPGVVVGASDAEGGQPDSDGYTPAGMAATIFHLLGIGRGTEFHDSQGRPYQLYQGEPITPLLSG